MSMPLEFTPARVKLAAEGSHPSYVAYHNSGEPYRSLIDHNPWLRPPKSGQELEWDAGWYYDTTIARLHPDWQHTDLPQPTKSLGQLQHDFIEWGYCLIEDGVSASQCQQLHTRVAEQAAAERALGIAHLNAAQQHVWALVNKGRIFEQCMEHSPDGVQSGALIEHLLDQLIGADWHHLSFIANISYPGCHPQGMHQDQSLIAPYTTAVPVLINTIYILQDVDHINGGTLLIPGSHRPPEDPMQQFGPLPRPINLEAPAGTILLTDGRLLHGGAVNRSDQLRYIITNSVVRPWIRQQECFHLTIRPEVLNRASDIFLMRCGFQATASRSMVEGYGYTGNGRLGDPNGALKYSRQAMDAGRYQWVGELKPGLDESRLPNFTLAEIQQTHETHRGASYQSLMAKIDPQA